jgi:hypothetical protein
MHYSLNLPPPFVGTLFFKRACGTHVALLKKREER